MRPPGGKSKGSRSSLVSSVEMQKPLARRESPPFQGVEARPWVKGRLWVCMLSGATGLQKPRNQESIRSRAGIKPFAGLRRQILSLLDRARDAA